MSRGALSHSFTVRYPVIYHTSTYALSYGHKVTYHVGTRLERNRRVPYLREKVLKNGKVHRSPGLAVEFYLAASAPLL